MAFPSNDGFRGPPQPVPGLPGGPAPPMAPPPPPPYGMPAGAPAYPARPAYRDGKGLATAIAVLLPIYLLLNVAQAAVPPEIDTGSAAQPGVYYRFSTGILGLLGMGSFIALAILAPLWLARAHRNAEALTGTPIGTSAGWTAGAWFIPVLGGFLAASPLAKLWARGPGGGKGLPMLWAILWSLSQLVMVVLVAVVLASAFSAVVAGADGQPSPDEMARIQQEAQQSVWPFVLVQTAILVASGACMWLTVRAIQSWQSQAAARLPPPSPPAWPAAPPQWR